VEPLKKGLPREVVQMLIAAGINVRALDMKQPLLVHASNPDVVGGGEQKRHPIHPPYFKHVGKR
jgi:hypothetical protein